MAQEVPRKDEALRNFAVTFHSACGGHLTTLGLTSAQLTVLNDKLTAFDVSIAEHLQKRVDALAATATKDAANRDLADTLRPLIRIIRGHDVPVGLLEQLGIGSIDPNHPVAPEQPGTLSVTPFANGTNWLKWHRGSNKRGTTYVVEVLNSETGGWHMLATVNRLSYRHEYQEPGYEQSYRVRAVRKGVPGIPTFPITVYGLDQSAEAAQLKVA